jgi:hypothetical protein
MTRKEQRKAAQRLIRKLFVLSVLLVSLAFLTSFGPTPARAEGWAECNFPYLDSSVGCIWAFNQCLSGCQDSQCRSGCADAYQNCAIDAHETRTECVYNIDPQPLPVEDDSREICMEGCQSCYDQGYTIEAFQCYNTCYDYCDENFPKP